WAISAIKVNCGGRFSERAHAIEIELPIARRRLAARKPRARDLALPLDRQHHAAQEFCTHLRRTPRDHRIRSGLPPGIARTKIARRLCVLLHVEGTFEQTTYSGSRMLVAIGDAACGGEDAIEPKQPARALPYGEAGDDARHAKLRQHAA